MSQPFAGRIWRCRTAEQWHLPKISEDEDRQGHGREGRTMSDSACLLSLLQEKKKLS